MSLTHNVSVPRRPKQVCCFQDLSCRLAFLPGHCEKRSGLLFNVLTSAVRADELFFVMLLQGENCLEGLVAVVADVVVYGHGVTSHDSLPIVARFGTEECTVHGMNNHL